MSALEVDLRVAAPRLTRHAQGRASLSPPLLATSVVVADWSGVIVAAMIAYGGRFGFGYPLEQVPTWFLVVMPAAWLVVLTMFGVYSSLHLQAGMAEYQRLVLGTSIFAGGTAMVCYLLKFDLSRGFFLLLFVVGLPVMLVLRLMRRGTLRRLRRRGMLQSPVLIVGSPAHIDDVTRVLHRENWLGYRVIGAVTSGGPRTPRGVPVLAGLDEIVELVKASDVHAVIFAEGSFRDAQHFRRTAWELEAQDVHVIVVPAITDISAGRLKQRPVGGLPLVHVDRPQALAAGRWNKRLFDIVGSSVLLLLVLPVLVAVALAIRLEDAGPFLFRQTRVGRGGQRFECLKIRSMVVDAEALKASLQSSNEGAGVLFKMAHDPRINRVGRFIRRFSIDELPQLWNVLRGDMSLVGPRPGLPKEVAQYDRDAERRLDVRPGLTGLWQVSGRSDLSWEETIRLDTYYVDNWSLLQDLAILMRTTGAVVSSRGAY